MIVICPIVTVILFQGRVCAMESKRNSGFSLIELIIVIAIMAILVAVLAPQYLRYVDKARYSRDVQAIDQVYMVVQTAVADPDVAVQLKNNVVIRFVPPNDGQKQGSSYYLAGMQADSANPQLEAAIKDMLGSSSEGSSYLNIFGLSCRNYSDDPDEIPSSVKESLSSGSIQPGYPHIIVLTDGTAYEYIPSYDPN